MDETPQNQRTKLVEGINVVVIAVAAVAITVLANGIFSQFDTRFDMTSNRLYTLSPVSEKTVEELEHTVEVRAFVSPDLPPPYHRLDQQIDEILAEYEAAGDGMVDYEIVSPEDPEEIRELAAGYGIQPVTIGRQTESERRVRSVFKGVAFVQGDQQETIPDLQVAGGGRLDNFEYDFTRALMNLQRPEPRRVAVISGHGGPVDRPEQIASLRRVFENTYGGLVELHPVDFTSERPLDEGFEALIAVDIDEDLEDRALQAIDDFVQHGGNVGWFQTGAVVDREAYREELENHTGSRRQFLPVPPRRRVETNLAAYFAGLGLEYRADAVIDRERAIAYSAVPTRRGPARVGHPGLFPIEDVDRELTFARHFSTVILPAPSTIRIDGSRIPSDVAVHELLRTSETSTRLPNPPSRLLYDQLRRDNPDAEPGPHVVAAALEGPLPSVFGSGDSAEDGRALVVGSGEFIGEVPEVGYRGELTGLGLRFFVNAVEWLAEHDELADIRGKSMPELIAEVPREIQRSIKFINIALVPSLFASVGLAMWVRRRRRKRELDEKFGDGPTGENETSAQDEK